MTITTKAFRWASNPKNTWIGIAARAVVVMSMLPVLVVVDILAALASGLMKSGTPSAAADMLASGPSARTTGALNWMAFHERD